MYVCWARAACAEARGQPVEVDFPPLPCPFHPRAHSSSMAASSFTFWAILQVPSQLAIPKETSRVSLLESDTFRKHGSLAGLGVSGQAVYSHLLS